ncbi:MAG: DNA-binding protein [Verrucomicrobia bacterium]|nr:MAG: DNA-binding protein [Verrucomicrobiota bacterium]
MPAAWTPLPSLSPIPEHTLAETLDGGQCFRWNRHADGTWSGVSGHLALDVRSSGSALEVRIHGGDMAAAITHLGADRDWHDLADQLPWRTDPHLARCIDAFPGLRILRQPIGETLLGFLCSTNKRIPQIKQIIARLADTLGEPIAPGIHALPTWERLAATSEETLRACGLGYRARHIAAVARRLAAEPGLLRAIEEMTWPEAREALQSLPGVGPKVADCVLLFGAGRLEAFPVDTWIERAMRSRYHLEGWSPAQIAHFGRVHFGHLAGLAQQYLFAGERLSARS